MYQALYRTWRPTTFADMVGQEHITRTLARQVEANRLSHAYLLTGTRGTGKTSCAKVLAKAVNCENPQQGNPCNQCVSCKGIQDGSVLDVLELDAASNNGVDQVRALRDEAVYTPASVKMRVYIIDEVHMLSAPAFNALLKILEEPPAHVLFILATTELHKISPTIRSRCQHFSFKRILPQEIKGRLQYIAHQEYIPLTADGCALLSRLANGGLRDALSLLDQCRDSACVDETHILNVLGLAGNEDTASLVEYVVTQDSDAALLQLSQLYENGRDISAILDEMAVLMRDLLLLKTAPKHGEALLLGGYDNTTLLTLDVKTTSQQLLYGLHVLQETLAQLPSSKNRRTAGELCLLRLCDPSLEETTVALSARMSQLEDQVKQGILSGAFSVVQKNAPVIGNVAAVGVLPTQGQNVPNTNTQTINQSVIPPTSEQFASPIPNQVGSPPMQEIQEQFTASTINQNMPNQGMTSTQAPPDSTINEENAWYMMEAPDWLDSEGYDMDFDDPWYGDEVPVDTYKVQPVAQPPMQPMAQPPMQPMAQPPMQPMAQPPMQPMAQPPMQPMAQPPMQPMGQPPVQPMAQPPVAPVPTTGQNMSLDGCDQGAVWQGFLATYISQVPPWAKPYLSNGNKVKGFFGNGRMNLRVDSPFTEKTLKKDNLSKKLEELLSQYAGSPVNVLIQLQRDGMASLSGGGSVMPTSVAPMMTPQPMMNPQPMVTENPQAVANPQPMVTETPQPVMNPQPMATETPQPVMNPQPMVTETPQPMMNPQPMAMETPQPMMNPQPMAMETPQPVMNPQPMATETPQPVMNPQPMAMETPQPVMNPQPMAMETPQPMMNPQPMATETPQPVMNPQPMATETPQPMVMEPQQPVATPQGNETEQDLPPWETPNQDGESLSGEALDEDDPLNDLMALEQEFNS